MTDEDDNWNPRPVVYPYSFRPPSRLLGTTRHIVIPGRVGGETEPRIVDTP